MGKVGFIYETVNKVDGRKYIGRKSYSSNYGGGWQVYLGSSKSLKQDIETHGVECFERRIIEECDTYEELQQRELYWQLHYKVKEDPQYYNITYANEGFDTSGVRFTYTAEELKKIWSEERRLEKSNWMKDPKNNPNNLPHVRKQRSERLKKHNIFKDPEFIRRNKKLKGKSVAYLYNDVRYEFNSVTDAKLMFGNAAVSVRQTGFKKNMPFRGLKYVEQS